MLRRVLQLSTHPRMLLRSVLALDDSPHSIALGVAIGIFVGLTPSVGIQTILIIALVFMTRPFFYFNGTAAMASTYISNPLTMAPMYYFWYRLGAWFIPGYSGDVNFDSLLEFEGLAGWWTATCALAVQVGVPMLVGALLTAPIGAGLAYPLTRYLVQSFRSSSGGGSNSDGDSDAGGRVDDAHNDVPDPNVESDDPAQSHPSTSTLGVVSASA